MKPIVTFFAALALVGALGACATDQTADRGPAYVVVEENASISNRDLVRRIAILDDNLLLIEEGAGRYYQATLMPGCADEFDIISPVRLEETGIGIDRGTRFIIDGRTCVVRRLDRVERVTPAERAAADTASSPTN